MNDYDYEGSYPVRPWNVTHPVSFVVSPTEHSYDEYVAVAVVLDPSYSVASQLLDLHDEQLYSPSSSSSSCCC